MRFLRYEAHANKEEREVDDARGGHDDARLPHGVAVQGVAVQRLLTRADARARKCVLARKREAEDLHLAQRLEAPLEVGDGGHPL